MFFKSSNYSVTDFSNTYFTKMTETNCPIEFVTNLNDKIFYTQENVIYKYGRKNVKKVNKFDNKISCLKNINSILIAGDCKGNLKIIGDKNIVLRSYNEHQDKINDIELYKKKFLFSCSNDNTIRVFDITKDKSIAVITGFNDHIKVCLLVGDALYCGTMGNFLYKVDVKTYKIVEKVDLEVPLYKIASTDDSILIFSSFNTVCTYDSQKKESKRIITLSKEITHLSIEDRNICTTSLDGYFRTWSLTGLLISQINLYSPILSASISLDFIFFGLSNGDLCKITIKEEELEEEEAQIVSNPRIKAFEKQIKQELIKNEIVKSNKVEGLIRKYAHVEALQVCLEDYSLQDIFSVLHHLQQEDKLTNVLTYIDKKYIYVLLDFIIENFFVVEFFSLFYDCLIQIVTIYQEDIYNENELMEKINILRELVDQETYFQEKVIETVSLFECYESGMNSL